MRCIAVVTQDTVRFFGSFTGRDGKQMVLEAWFSEAGAGRFSDSCLCRFLPGNFCVSFIPNVYSTISGCVPLRMLSSVSLG